ncbi:MAG TPA: hypothetical protein PLM07_01935 [Candidatus Rifleibacterium sp.]|nr:hypothetical protein [Candidatus Rifleibacterium sp.]HPT44640.1 hypothetical protein [Candidatus Rifleibacterium sp.]
MGRSLAECVDNCRCVAIIGMEKNAGKTTVLNYLLGRRLPLIHAITSIGYDGEDTDQVTGTDKPAIYVGCGTLVATASGLLGACDFTRELLRFTDFHTPMGEVVILRALSDGYAQIAGPSTTVQMSALVEMLHRAGAERVYIDGAAARKSTAALSTSDACILATGASFSHNIEETVEQTRHYVELLTLPRFEPGLPAGVPTDNINDCLIFSGDGTLVNSCSALDDQCAELIAARNGESTCVMVRGAFTQRLAQRLLDKCRQLGWLRLVGEDGTRLLISASQKSEMMRRGCNLQVLNRVNLCAVTVNPVSPAGLVFDSGDLCRRLARTISLPVFDVLAGQQMFV